MTLIRESPNGTGWLTKVVREYRRLRRDQAAHHPHFTMRMSRRAAWSAAWSRRKWLL